jgi:hypothetical protein
LASGTLVQDGRDETVLKIADVTVAYRLRGLEPMWAPAGEKTTTRAHASELRRR